MNWDCSYYSGTMIDLSFLTEEEQEAILTVLKRDAELKKAEEQRVQKLQQNMTDKGQLKYLTGEWFYETKQLRHQERIHGTDIIWASMKHTHKPMTILELSQMAPQRPSFVSSENKEVFVPPVLSGLLQEPLTQAAQPRSHGDPEVQNPYELQESPKPLVQSPTRLRRNPFNSEPDEPVVTQDNGQLADGAVQHPNSQMDEYILPTDLINPYGALQNLDPANPFYAISQKSVLTPVPEESTDTTCEDVTAEVDGPEGRQLNLVTPRGILKYMLSPTDSPDLDSQSSVSAESPVEAWTDRKQVRFSSVKRQDGKELGEHSLLDVDLFTPSETENNSEAGSKTTSNVTESEVLVPDGSHQQALGDQSETCQAEAQSQVSVIISTNQESGKLHVETQAEEDHAPQIQSNEKQLTNESSKKSSHAISPKPKQRLFGIFRRDKWKNTQKEEGKESKQKEVQIDNENLSQTVVDIKNEQEKPTAPAETTQVKTLQLNAMQNTPFTETVAPADVPLPTAEDRGFQSPECVSDLKAFWEMENFGPQIKLTRETERHEEDAKIDSSESIKPCVESIERNRDGKENEIAAKTQEEIRSADSKLLLEVSKEDDTYRAFPVLIYEDNDDCIICSIPESQICKPKQSPVLRQLASQESKPTNVGELKSFWESTSAPCSPVRSSKVSVSELKTSVDSQKKEDVVPLSPSKTKSIVVNEKGFVSQGVERSPSKGNVGDVHKTWQQVKEGANLQDRPYSPSRSPSKRFKEQDDEVRRSPSKTCHPRVLPRESASPQGSRPGSPLRTFPIVIDPEDQLVKPAPLQRQKKSPSHEAKASMDSATDVCSPKIPRSPEKTPLVRSIVPQDYQHYLGPREKAHVPPFQQTDAQDTNALQSPFRELAGKQSGSLPKDPRVSSWIEQIKDCSEEDATTRAWTLSRASAGSYDDKSSPVMSALKRLSSKMSTSKSLEDLISPTREAIGQINRSVDDVSEIPSTTSFASSKKSSVSVPAFQLDETDSDSPFENNLSWRRNTGSSTSNISLSSGMASMSSEVSGSMTSIYHADLGDVDVQGTIQFAVNYIQKLGEFHIFVVHCRDLAIGDSKKSRSDPYVKCYLLPDKTKLGKRKTTVKKKTVNPTYNEILRFKILLEVLKTQHLNLSVWHNDTFGRNGFLGEVDLDLSEWDFSNTQMNEYALKARTTAALTPSLSPSHSVNSRGQMRVALRFLPQTLHSKTTSRVESGEVQIWVKDCKNLPPIRGVIIDPFVKCAVLPDTSRKSRQKTRVVKRTANPMFNHTMVYDGFRPEDLREACVELTVWDHDRLNNHYIGGIRLGLGTGKSYGVDVNWMDSTTTEANLWQKMLESNGEWVEEVLPLRMLLMAKSMSK